ncbi:TonB-dependent receptor [Acinetobacter qingfengensis]|uniref:Ferrichrome-iron receptor n=2 Tax=Acinetobacter qingfengensis TaxID=1262585 RepID=A0A1E7RF84_9GAMM|nr:TonB-dependent receptor [Acinetobacter qingfengensis]OEY97946.1 ferrichrome-iron receptor [Acinetobacter qingfengensis]
MRPVGFFYVGMIISTISSLSFAEQIRQLETLVINTTDQPMGYQNKSSETATKFQLDELKTPQNIQTVNANLLRDRDVQRVSDVIGLVSGVSALNPMGGLWDNYSIRGFNTDQTLGASGLRNGINANLGMSAARDMVNIDSIEFLKGPEAAMYGAGDPGGTLNVITKKPSFSPEHQISLRAGTYDQYRIALDSSNAITDHLAYRLGIAYENNHSFRDYVKNDRLFIAPQFTWQINDQTQLDYDSEYSLTNNLFDRGVLAVNQQLGQIPKSRFLGEPKDGLMNMNDYLQQIRIKHQMDNGWNSESTINFKHNSWQGYSTEAWKLKQNDNLNRERRYRQYATTSYLFQQDLTGELNTGNIQHKLYIGATASTLKVDNDLHRYRKDGVNEQNLINIDYPVYGIDLPTVAPTYRTIEHQNNLALTLSDYMTLNDEWSVLLGGRFDYYQQKYQEFIQSISGRQNIYHFSPKFAINYSPNNQWSIFMNVGQSFHLNSGLDIQNHAFDPEKAWTYELGSKWKLWDDRVTATTSIFHITKQNVLTTNPIDSAYMITAGEEKSRGFEFDLAAQPIEDLNLRLAYSYTDAYVSKSDNNSGIPVGARLLNSAKHSANLFAMYDFWQKDDRKLGVGGNIQYISARAGNIADDGFELPSYTLLNLNAYYQLNPELRFQFTLNNVLNKTYYTSSLKDVWVTPGNPREVFLSIDYKF